MLHHRLLHHQTPPQDTPHLLGVVVLMLLPPPMTVLALPLLMKYMAPVMAPLMAPPHGSPHASRDGSPVSSVISSASAQPQGKKKTKKTDNSLSPANEGLLLEFIVENPMLWDKRLNDYRNLSKKAKVWEEQATQMGKDVKHLQGWYTSLRDSHTRMHKKKSSDGAREWTERDQWIKENFGFLLTVVTHRPEPCKSIKATIAEHPGDLAAAEDACADQQLGQSPDPTPEPTPSTSAATSSSLPKGKGRGNRAKTDDDDALLSALQKRIDESGAALQNLQARQQQPVTERSTFTNYVHDSLLSM
ncbi:hypothetical protein GWK47_029491 [Chionoecetes opilio]|uniref:MADF domain-containing protein n=1 Tax=Chionoecetes opilio TaxID=41210 RepID=A0A8J4YSG3_CHIOP|nr:hypothetical protein GWK47_029491 [Chionoecetes opilio]